MLATALIMALMLSVQVTPASAGILGTTFDYESLIDQYKPSLQYMYDEQYFPVDFYFDHDLNEENNKQNYQNHVGNWDTYVVFAHAKDNVWLYIQGVYYGPFIAIEYWYYYVADTGIEAHDQDWELHFEILIWQNTHQPFQARVGGHGYFLEGWRAWALIEKDNGHPKIYIDKKHAAHFSGDLRFTGFYLHWYSSDYKVSYVEGYTDYTYYNGEWYTYMSYQGYHVYWNTFSRYYWPAHYVSLCLLSEWRATYIKCTMAKNYME